MWSVVRMFKGKCTRQDPKAAGFLKSSHRVVLFSCFPGPLYSVDRFLKRFFFSPGGPHFLPWSPETEAFPYLEPGQKFLIWTK